MKYITYDQFKELDGNVQKVFIDWWKPFIGDLYCDVDAYGKDDIRCAKTLDGLECLETDKRYFYYVPLFTLHQLWDFLEDKTNSKIEIKYLNPHRTHGKKEYKIMILENGNVYGYDRMSESEDKLQALWQVAVGIAEGEVKSSSK